MIAFQKNKWFKPGVSQLIILLLIYILLSVKLFGQAPSAIAILQKNSMRIGEQTELVLKVNYNSKSVSKVTFPIINDTIIKGIEIISKSEVVKNTPDKSNPSAIEQEQKLIITCFDSGYYAIPPFIFMVNNDTAQRIETEALLLQVQTVDADTTKPIKDIKQPMDAPFSFEEAVPYILSIAGVIAIALVAYYLYDKNKKRPIIIKPKQPEIPPHVLALNELEVIQQKKLWQENKYKEYYSSITDVLRNYIEKRFPVNAMELTTDEIIYRFRKINISRTTKEKLKQTLLLSDMVKFAKEIPLADENELAIKNAIEFVNETVISEELEKTDDNA
jgi:hypothetical protein